MSEQGKKYDDGKLDWSLLDFSALEYVVEVLQYGAAKYGRDNWRGVPDAPRRYFAALMRHLAVYSTDPQAHDEESGLPHIAHAVCNALFLLSFALDRAADEAPEATPHVIPRPDAELESALHAMAMRLKQERLERDRAPSALMSQNRWGEHFD